MSSGITPARLLTQLIAEKLLDPIAPTMPVNASERPWFVSLLLGASGWLAGIFAIVLIGQLFTPSTSAGWLLASVVTFAAAYGLYAVDKESAFVDQLALALSVAGQVTFLIGVAEVIKSSAGIASVAAIMQCLLVLTLPNRFAKLLSAIFACIAWSLAIRLGWWDHDLWSNPLRTGVALAPALLGWFVIWAPVAAFTAVLIAREAQWMATKWRATCRPLLTGLLLSLSFGTFASQPIAALQLFLSDGEAAENWLVLWPLLSTTAAIFAFLAAFRVRHRAAMGAALVAIFLHVFQFYYLLGTSLLVKSVIMVTIGAAMLVGARLFTNPSTGAV